MVLSWAILLAKYTDSPAIAFGIISGSEDNQCHDDTAVDEYRASLNPDSCLPTAIPLASRRQYRFHEWKYDARINTCIANTSCTAWLNHWVNSPDHGIKLVLVAKQGRLACMSLYGKSSYIDEGSLRFLCTAFQHILHGVLESPTGLLKSIEVTPNHHYQQILDWNSNIPKKPLAERIHDVIQRRCKETPNAEAICAWDGTMTYAALDQESTKTMEYLRHHGVEPETIVPLLFEKTKWTAVAVLGVLKAGAAFVLLDASHPIERLKSICCDIGTCIILTSDFCKELGSNLADMTMSVPSDVERNLPYSDGEMGPCTLVQPRNAAYVAYTSGSTGKPKGVIIEHTSFCSNAMVSSEAQNLNRSSRVLQFASYAFDVSIHETLVPLMLGGCVCIPSASQRVNNLQEAIIQLRVNWMELTPSVTRLLNPHKIPDVKTLVVGGESISPAELARWADHVRLNVAYGPAECTVVSMVQSNVTKHADPLSIGRGCGGSVWIVELENHNMLVPIGAAGELVIGGPIVGRGYLNRPEQTAAVFIQNPLWQAENNSRFYKTGDVVRQKADGSIVFLGRKDTQVKLRGQRIELGEIEHHVAGFFPGAAVAVEVGKLYHGHSALVSFVEWKSLKKRKTCSGANCCWAIRNDNNQFTSNVQRAKAGLSQILPSYMIPDVIVPLCTIPLSHSAKVDRKALQAMIPRWSKEEVKLYQVTTHSPSLNRSPHGVGQKHAQMVQIVARVLSLDPSEIGEHDNFFQLGGDSLSAIMLSRETDTMPLVYLTVADIFQSTSIAEMSHRSQKKSLLKSMRPGVPANVLPFSLLDPMKIDNYRELTAEHCDVNPSQIEDIYPCSPIQARLMARTARQPGAFQGSFNFRLSPGIDWERLHWAWNKAIDALPILRTRIINTWQLADGNPLQVIVRGKDIDWVEVETASESEPSSFMTFGSPLIFCVAVRHKVSPVLILNIHHALFDLVVFEQILEAVEAAYRGNPLVWRPFSPFIKYVQDLDSSQAMEFWKQEFIGLRANLFPANRTHIRSNLDAIRWTRKSFHLGPRNQSGTTISSVIRLVWAMVLSQYTGSPDVVFGATVMGRNMPGTSDVGGPTIATYPLRITLRGEESIKEALQRVQNHGIAIAPFEQFGIQHIRQSSLESAIACNFQNMLVIQPSSDNSFLAKRDSSPLLVLEECGSWKETSYVKFSTQALNVVCEPGADHLEVTAYFDQNIMSSQDVIEILNCMNRLLQLVLQHPHASMGTILSQNRQFDGEVDHYEERTSLARLEQAACQYLGNGIPVAAEWIIPKASHVPKLALFVGVLSLNTVSDDAWVLAEVKEPLRARLLQMMDDFQNNPLRRTIPFCCIPVPLQYRPSKPGLLLDRARAREGVSKLTWKMLTLWQNPPNCGSEVPLLPLEATLRQALATVLCLESDSIGVHDDLVSLGCDSLVAMQFTAQCNQQNLRVTISDIFQATSLSSLASTLHSRPSGDPTPTSEAFSLLRPMYVDRASFERDIQESIDGWDIKDSIDVFPCTAVHLGLLSGLGTCQSYTIWEVGSPEERVDPAHLAKAWLQLVNRHAALRTLLLPSRSNPSQWFHVVLKSSPIAVKLMTNLEDASVLKVARRPLLSKGGLGGAPYKFAIYQSTTGRTLCKLEGRYAFLDAFSVLVLMKELRLILDFLPISDRLPPPYASWVAYLRRWRENPLHLQFWDRYLAGLKPCVLPAFRNHHNQQYQGCQYHGINETNGNSSRVMKSHRQTIVQDIVAFRNHCDQLETTITNVLQVAWALVLREQTGTDDICFGTLVSGRDVPVHDIGNIVGSFFNVVACRIEMQATESIGPVLLQNHRMMRERASHQFCSLQEVTRLVLKAGPDASSLFNTCLSVEQPLSDKTETGNRFIALETVEETEYDLIITATVFLDRIEANIMYWSYFFNPVRAATIAEKFSQSIERIISCTQESRDHVQ
ncbi:amino acid adenylation domain-containing protein [Penicillium canescens]|uniref:Amino acid adenylation domain-containing protein n=1 Tax=Penicillium canescens TaxID=5083 RepID=A0AAD6NBP6_PENCN|nr:amino acid adenylation domain-containing protein [Penicillium canescens]KAJ6085801.1 amino acid adenylation domain-containing protein [Penicillium canescens]KAJ6162574.1 amino acid adenylation domain-containing protein [Penicillium canescens]